MSIDFYSDSVAPEVPVKRNWLFAVILSALLGGAVLGLYLAKQLIERHGGTLRIESKVDVGTAVRFTLPPNGTTEDSPVS